MLWSIINLQRTKLFKNWHSITQWPPTILSSSVKYRGSWATSSSTLKYWWAWSCADSYRWSQSRGQQLQHAQKTLFSGSLKLLNIVIFWSLLKDIPWSLRSDRICLLFSILQHFNQFWILVLTCEIMFLCIVKTYYSY